MFGRDCWRAEVKERPKEQHGGAGHRSVDHEFVEPGVAIAHRTFKAVILAAERLGRTHDELVSAAAAVSAPRSPGETAPGLVSLTAPLQDPSALGDKYDDIKRRRQAVPGLFGAGKKAKLGASVPGRRLPESLAEPKGTPAVAAVGLDIVAFLHSIDPPLSCLSHVLRRLEGRPRLTLHHFASIAAAHQDLSFPPQSVAAYLMVSDLLGIVAAADVLHFTHALHQLRP